MWMLRISRATRLVAALVLALSVMLSLGTAACLAATPGTGGWYWPTGTEDFSGWSGWWDARGGSWHLAQDMHHPAGASVVAIGSGTVLESKYVGGYGPGGNQGGAVVILHKTAAGKEFKGLYGHLSNLKYAKGDTVAAGAVIGTINNSSPNHLHFGIHPGRAYPSDNNPFRGHTYASSNTYGFVDPVAFMKDNPRVIPYAAPALPTVVSLTTTSTPTSVTAAAGTVYWRQSTAETVTAWRYSIASRKIATMSVDATIPASDMKRYVIGVSATRPGLTVVDKRPCVATSPANWTPPYGTATVIRGTVNNAVGSVFKGATVTLQRWTGSTWVDVARGLTLANGSYSMSYRTSSRTALRTRFAPPRDYTISVSSTVTVVPHVYLSRPTLSVTSPRPGALFYASSYLKPKHASTASVSFYLERKTASGSWVAVTSGEARLTDATKGTLCRKALRCSTRGSWRVRSRMAGDGSHATSYSPWRYFSVR